MLIQKKENVSQIRKKTHRLKCDIEESKESKQSFD